MALIASNAPELSGVSFDPEYFSEDTLRALFSGAEPEPLREPDFPFLDLIDTGADREAAINAVRSAFVSGAFLEEEFGAYQASIEAPLDRAALFEEVAAAQRALPRVEDIVTRLDADNAGLSDVLELIETNNTMELWVEGEVRVQMPLALGQDKNFGKVVLLVKLALDVMSLVFALLDVPVTLGNKWADQITHKLDKWRDWLTSAKRQFAYFENAYTIYQAAMAKSAANDADPETGTARGKSQKAKAIAAASVEFAGALFNMLKFLVKKGWEILKLVVKFIFSNWRKVLKALAQVTLAVLEWVAAGVYKTAEALAKAVLCAFAVLEDFAKWNKLYG
ncbi:hypothetical protein [Shimia sp. Alg240-R146]|uniref:hypothetical protein n=1 Tax=Shimia sp. Alg240-R146 TaxID=2993449 RepID=UPI0022E6F25F|nr:hypothetical protein [Shimia sp. Alg240-R146]